MNGKPKSPVLPCILGILLLYTTYTRWPETEHMLDVLFGSTPSYLQRYFSMRPMDFLVLIIPLLGIICLFTLLSDSGDEKTARTGGALL